jgi:hypothetical protein
MKNRLQRRSFAVSLTDASLEHKLVMTAGGLSQSAAEVAAMAAGTVPTHTKLAVSTGTLGDPVDITVTVKAHGSAASSPTGTVDIVDQGQTIQTLTLAPSTGGRGGSSAVSVSLIPQPGGSALYFGKHSLTAEYVPSGSFGASKASKPFSVRQPKYTTLPNSGGVKVATIAQGSGAGVQSGQTASVLYTGYLAKNGEIFDDSANHGGAPFSFTVGAGQVIPGFDSGVAGMKVGETRIVKIPAAEGYGSSAAGSIPANSTLIFVLTLESIS